MEGLKHDIEQTAEIASEYIKTEIDLLKVDLVDKVSGVLASLIARVALIVLLILPFFFGLIALGFYLSEIYGSHATGFGLVAGGIAVLYIIGLVARKFLIVNPLQNFFIHQFADALFTEDADKEKDKAE